MINKFLEIRKELSPFELEVFGEILKQSYVQKTDVPEQIQVKTNNSIDLVSLNKQLENIRLMATETSYKDNLLTIKLIKHIDFPKYSDEVGLSYLGVATYMAYFLNRSYIPFDYPLNFFEYLMKLYKNKGENIFEKFETDIIYDDDRIMRVALYHSDDFYVTDDYGRDRTLYTKPNVYKKGLLNKFPLPTSVAEQLLIYCQNLNK